MHSHSSLENHTRFQTKMSKVYTPLRPKWCTGSENTTRLGRHLHLYGLYWGVPPRDQMKLSNTHTTTKDTDNGFRNTKKHTKQIMETLSIQVT